MPDWSTASRVRTLAPIPAGAANPPALTVSSRRRRRQHQQAQQRAHERERRQTPVRLPSELAQQCSDVSLQLARRALLRRRWREAMAYATTARQSSPTQADALFAEAAYRESR